MDGPRGVDHEPARRSTWAALGGVGPFLGPDADRAASYDVALLDVFATAVGGIVHAFALAEAEDIAPTTLAIHDEHRRDAAGDDQRLRRADRVDEFPGDRSTLSSAASGIQHVLVTAERHGIDTGALSTLQKLIDGAVQPGHGDDGLARMADILRPVHAS